MKRELVTSILLCFAALFPCAVEADQPVETSSHVLSEACREALLSPPPDGYYKARGLCGDFIREIVETRGSQAVIRVDRGKGVVSEYSYCFPIGPRDRYLAKVLVGWAQRNPEKFLEHYETGMLDAVEELFPCEGPWDQERKRARAKKSAARDKQ